LLFNGTPAGGYSGQYYRLTGEVIAAPDVPVKAGFPEGNKKLVNISFLTKIWKNDEY